VVVGKEPEAEEVLDQQEGGGDAGDDADRRHRPAAFLVAFSAALLLIDAARFIRDAFEPLPLVRKKLNQPEPHFGIPKNTYDTVQKSLTSTRHAWHLYHAVKYFDEHSAELQSLVAADPLLQPVAATVDRLRTRLQVSKRSYVKAKLHDRARRTAGRLHHGLFGRAIYGVQKLFSSMAADVYTRPGHHPVLPDAIARQFRDLLGPGDVLITRKEHAVTNYFLPGYWKHAALYLGEASELGRLGIADREHVRPHREKGRSKNDSGTVPIFPQGKWDCPPCSPCVLEAMKDGVWIRPLSSPFSADSLLAIRPRLADADVAAALARGLFHEGKPYDFDFDFTRADRLVCTEVVYRSYEGIAEVGFELTRRAGRLTLSAEDLVGMSLRRQHFEPLAVFSPRHAPELAVGEVAASILAETRIA